MKNLSGLKSTLEKLLKIASWNPTASQLDKIANELARARATSIDDVETIVANICPDTKFIVLAGVDNSDIRALLALALQIANSKK